MVELCWSLESDKPQLDSQPLHFPAVISGQTSQSEELRMEVLCSGSIAGLLGSNSSSPTKKGVGATSFSSSMKTAGLQG